MSKDIRAKQRDGRTDVRPVTVDDSARRIKEILNQPNGFTLVMQATMDGSADFRVAAAELSRRRNTLRAKARRLSVCAADVILC